MLNLNNTLDGYLKNVEVIGNTIQDAENLADIRSVGDKVAGQELYEIPVLSCGKNLFNGFIQETSSSSNYYDNLTNTYIASSRVGIESFYTCIKVDGRSTYLNFAKEGSVEFAYKYTDDKPTNFVEAITSTKIVGVTYAHNTNGCKYLVITFRTLTNETLAKIKDIMVSEGSAMIPYEPYQEDKLTILSPVQLEKVGDVVDRIICKNGVWGVDKKVDAEVKNNVLVNVRTNSEFIPLPYDQQVKLRTFAGQTNIAFLTEIAGQIKAQVPKSLGATVNTHTEQIADLHNSLERVKKLEETTVSTVETESKFTTVEETSNGYFEDIKLEGKTLVNLFDYSTPFNTHWKDITISQRFKPNTKYTFIVQSSGDASSLLLGVLNTNSNWSCLKEPYDVGNSIFMLTTDSNPTNTIRMGTVSPSGVGVTYNKIIILEGDHTNNPPEYFEGLRSVGQDVNEVSIESTNNGNLADNIEIEIGDIIASSGANGTRTDRERVKGFVEVTPNVNIYVRSKSINVFEYDANYKFIKVTLVNMSLKLSQNTKYIRFYAEIGKLTDINISYTDNFKNQPHQSNKKPLLYFNPTTETWEKPILREWDTIEKHADGKYYYHKRSEEVVLNGSEGWRTYSNEIDGTYAFYSPKFQINVINTSISNMYEGGYVASIINTTNTIGYALSDSRVYLRVPSSVATNVDSLKTYLKSNNFILVCKLAQEEVYECTNIDLMTYSKETNYIINSGAISPKSLLKVHNNISNVVKILQEKVSLLENTFIAGLKSVLAGDMYSLATILYPEDFEQNDNIEQDIMVIPE